MSRPSPFGDRCGTFTCSFSKILRGGGYRGVECLDRSPGDRWWQSHSRIVKIKKQLLDGKKHPKIEQNYVLIAKVGFNSCGLDF